MFYSTFSRTKGLGSKVRTLVIFVWEREPGSGAFGLKGPSAWTARLWLSFPSLLAARERLFGASCLVVSVSVWGHGTLYLSLSPITFGKVHCFFIKPVHTESTLRHTEVWLGSSWTHVPRFLRARTSGLPCPAAYPRDTILSFSYPAYILLGRCRGFLPPTFWILLFIFSL